MIQPLYKDYMAKNVEVTRKMCSLFNNAFSVTYDYIESNERMIGE
jgi:hypothetical protein